MVTSVTKAALLVQSGALVGRDGSMVGVCGPAGVAELSGEGGADVSVMAGGSVIETSAVATGACVAVTVDLPTSACPPPPQPHKTSASRAVTTNNFLIIFSLLCYH